jgi:hypothetical protein
MPADLWPPSWILAAIFKCVDLVSTHSVCIVVTVLCVCQTNINASSQSRKVLIPTLRGEQKRGEWIKKSSELKRCEWMKSVVVFISHRIFSIIFRLTVLKRNNKPDVCHSLSKLFSRKRLKRAVSFPYLFNH